jgi:two-component system NtrC family sensor kinase
MMDKPVRILCVDDERHILQTLGRFCRNEGHGMASAASAAEGLEILVREAVDVIISDFRMPGVNGLDFLREVSRKWPLSGRILLSGYADIPAVNQAVKDGEVDAFIPKPWNRDELRTAIRTAAARAIHP